MTDDDKWKLLRANCRLFVGVAEIAYLHFKGGEKDLAIQVLKKFLGYMNREFRCGIADIADPEIIAKREALFAEKMTQDYFCFQSVVFHLMGVMKGINLEIVPSVSELLKARGYTLDESGTIPEQIEAVTTWFVEDACSTFNHKWGMFI